MPADPRIEIAVFLAGFWAATKSLLDASQFVNDLRDTIVIGFKGDHALSIAHRRALRLDWLLTMAGAVGFPLAFAGILFAVAANVDPKQALTHIVLDVVAYVPLLGSILFVICGISDWRLMQRAVNACEDQGQLAKSETGHLGRVD